MPKPGFKSITVAEQVYDKFHEIYSENRIALAMKGVNSFAGYVTYKMEEMMEKDRVFAKYAPRMERVSMDDDRVILKDNAQDRIIEVSIEEGEPYCQFCEKWDCPHIGFVWSIPDVYEALDARGVKKH